MSAGTVRRWESVARKALVGRTIADVCYLSPGDAAECGWGDTGIVLSLDDGTTVLVQQDDEANGPGALLLIPKDEGKDATLLPTIRL